MIVTVTVTENDIKHGVSRNYCKCPIALAVSRMFPTAHIDVGTTRVLVRGGERDIRDNIRNMYARLPDAGKQLIQAFDSGNAVSPMEFDLHFSPYGTELTT
jgi:hypothetical protein